MQDKRTVLVVQHIVYILVCKIIASLLSFKIMVIFHINVCYVVMHPLLNKCSCGICPSNVLHFPSHHTTCMSLSLQNIVYFYPSTFCQIILTITIIIKFSYQRAHLDTLLKYIEDGVEEGATLVYGGKRVPRPGKY